MKLQLMAASAAAVLMCAAPAAAQPTPAEAKAFVENAEAQLDKANAFANRAQWVRANFITEDTQWLEAKANAEQNALVTSLAVAAAKFDGVAADPVTARKLKLLKLYLVTPEPNRPGAAEELAGLVTKLDSTYSSGKFAYKGKQITLNDAEDVMMTSRDPAELKAVWEGWHSVSPVMRADYAKFAALSNEDANRLGFKDTR